MLNSKVKFNSADEVKEFVTAASKCDFDIDIFYNRIIIDAKSLLGILSMDLTRNLNVRCYGENSEFNRTLQKFLLSHRNSAAGTGRRSKITIDREKL